MQLLSAAAAVAQIASTLEHLNSPRGTDLCPADTANTVTPTHC